MSSPKHAKLTETPPSSDVEYSLEDLDDLVMSTIMRKLNAEDRLCVTRASPSARRLCIGPRADPGVLGKLTLDIAHAQQGRKPIYRSMGVCFMISSSLVQPTELDQLCAWLSRRARAFESVELTLGRSTTEAVILSRLMSTLISGGFCGPAKFQGTVTKDDHALLAPVVQWETLMPGQPIELICSYFKPQGIEQALNQLRSVCKITIFDLTGPTSPSTFASLGPSLTSLTIDDVSTSVPIIFAPLPHLREFDLSNYSHLTPIAPTLQALAPSSASLRKLDLRYGPLTDLPHIVSALSALTALTELCVGVKGNRNNLNGLFTAPTTPLIVLPGLRKLELSCLVGDVTEDNGEYKFPFPLLPRLSCPMLHSCILRTDVQVNANITFDVSHLLKISDALRQVRLLLNDESKPTGWTLEPSDHSAHAVTDFLESLACFEVHGVTNCGFPPSKKVELRKGVSYYISFCGEAQTIYYSIAHFGKWEFF